MTECIDCKKIFKSPHGLKIHQSKCPKKTKVPTKDNHDPNIYSDTDFGQDGRLLNIDNIEDKAEWFYNRLRKLRKAYDETLDDMIKLNNEFEDQYKMLHDAYVRDINGWIDETNRVTQKLHESELQNRAMYIFIRSNDHILLKK